MTRFSFSQFTLIALVAITACDGTVQEPEEIPAKVTVETTVTQQPAAPAASTDSKLADRVGLLEDQIDELKRPQLLQINDDFSIPCTGEVETSHHQTVVITVDPAVSRRGWEVFDIGGVTCGKEINGQLNKLVDLQNRIVYAYMARTIDTSLEGAVPVAPKGRDWVTSSRWRCSTDPQYVGGCQAPLKPERVLVAYTYTNADGIEVKIPKGKIKEVYEDKK